MALRLEVVTECDRSGEHVYPGFDKDPRFDWNWWERDSAESPVSFCRFVDGEEEVGRAKVYRHTSPVVYGGYTSWRTPRDGVTEIDLFEIRPDLRGHGIGRRAVEAVARHYGDPVIAMSLDESSDLFWRSLGWTAHTHPDDDEDFSCYRTLYTSI